MLRKSIKFIFLFMAMTLFLTPAWGSTPDGTDVEDQALTFFRNHEVAETCVWVEFLESQSVIARGGGSGGGSGGGHGGGYGNNGSHRMGSQGTNAAQQNQHQYQKQQKAKRQNQHQYQRQQKTEKQNQPQHQYQHQQKTEKQNQHQYQYQHQEESGVQN